MKMSSSEYSRCFISMIGSFLAAMAKKMSCLALSADEIVTLNSAVPSDCFDNQ